MKRALVTALLALCVPCTAQAAVTGSQITVPADPYARFFDLSAGQGPYGIAVAGTVPFGTSSDRVDIRCYTADSAGEVLGTFPVDGPTQTFAGFVSPGTLTRPCVLRAVPVGVQPTDVTPFRGPRVYASILSDARVGSIASPNAGTLYDVFDRITGPKRTATLALGTLGGCGLYFARPLDPAGSPQAPGLDVFNCAGWTDLTADAGPQSRSDIVVDGHNAFTAGVLQNSEGRLSGVPGMPPTTVGRRYDAASGSLTLEETSAVVRCATDLSPYPPATAQAGAACGQLVGTGVRYARTTTTGADDHLVTVTDRWASTDGKAHPLDLLLEMDMGATTYGLLMPWVGPSFASYAGTASLPGPPGAPGTVYVRANAAQPDSVTAPVGSITYSTAPTSIEFYDDGNPVSRYPQLHYVRSVPPTGQLVIQHTYVIGEDLPNVRAAALLAEDRSAGPNVVIHDPHPNQAIRASRITVRGKATDNYGVRRTTVNGVAVRRTAAGSFARRIRLRRGSNRIVVKATDNQGNVAQVQITVRHGRFPACVVPSVVGLTRKGAAARLRNHACRLGRVASRYVAPRRVRKGGRLVTVRVRTGHVLSQRIRPGARRANGTRVGVTLQAPRPG